MMTFSEIKSSICVTLYFALRKSSGQEYFTIEEIQELASLDVGKAFVSRACSALDDEDLLIRSVYEEDTYYSLDIQGFEYAEELLKQGYDQAGRAPDSATFLTIPASDRVVTRGDNQKAFEELEAGVLELREVIKSDNKIGNELGDERDQLDHDLGVAEAEVKRDRFRLASLFGWLMPVLRFLGKRFAGTSVDELTTKLIQALEKLL